MSVRRGPLYSLAYPMRTGIPARKATRAEPNEFLKSTIWVNFSFLKAPAVAKGQAVFGRNQRSFSLEGESTCCTTGFARKVISADSKCRRMARRAGVQRIESPIGEGSHTKIFCSCMFCRKRTPMYLGCGLSSPLHYIKRQCHKLENSSKSKRNQNGVFLSNGIYQKPYTYQQTKKHKNLYHTGYHSHY